MLPYTCIATISLEVGMKEPLGLGMRNQIILSRTSRFVGSLEEEKVSLAWIWMGPMFMLQLERVLKGFMLPSKGSETHQSWSTLPKSVKYAAHSISDQTNTKHDDRFIVFNICLQGEKTRAAA